MAPQVRASQRQIKALAASIQMLLNTLDTKYHAEWLLESQSVALESLLQYVNLQFYQNVIHRSWKHRNSLLEEISQFVEKQTTDEFVKSLLTKEERHLQIESYYRRIEILVASFQIRFLNNSRPSFTILCF